MTANKPAWKRLVTNHLSVFIAVTLGVSVFAWAAAPMVAKRVRSVEQITVVEFDTVRVELSDSVLVHQGYARDCTLLGGFVADINDVAICVDAQVVPGIMWRGKIHDENFEVTKACLMAGGRMFNLSSEKYDFGCYTYTIFEELGARYDYRPTN